MTVKPIFWLGDSRKVIQAFPGDARREAGHQLDKVQHGLAPDDWKPLAAIGLAVNEIRIHAENEYRILYVAKFAEAVYVLHAFAKKTRQTAQQDIGLATHRYRQLLNERKRK